MPISKKYFHDKLILLLVSSIIFLAFLCSVLIFLRLGGGGEGYIVQYRSNLGISAFKTGSIVGILSFVAYAIVVAVVTILLSIRMYRIRRVLAVAVLGFGMLLLTLAIIVSNALTVLR